MKYAIGDVHGEITKLRQLVATILAADKHPGFLFIGDYLDKGEDSLATMRYLQQLSTQHPCVFLLGNHDFFWKYFSSDPAKHTDFLTKFGGLKTQQDFGAQSITETFDRLMSEFEGMVGEWRLFWESDQFLLTHAGLTREAYDKLPNEFTNQDVLFNRYDFIREGGRYRNKQIVFGHTAFYSVFTDGQKLGIDTGACYSPRHPLTALCLDDETIVNSLGMRFPLRALSTNFNPCVIRHKPTTLMDTPYDNFLR